ncbi:MAG: PRC-barrel domain-containing protein [Cyanobacteria bacterium P01_D01_bin.128]
MTATPVNHCRRSDLLGLPVRTRTETERLGIVNQIWVDLNRSTVVALELRQAHFAELIAARKRFIRFNGIQDISDVFWVDESSIIEDAINLEDCSRLIRSEVLTESAKVLGRVRDFEFEPMSGKVSALITDSLGLPQIPSQAVNTYQIFDGIVSSGRDRLSVFEGAEERLVQLSVGILGRLSIGCLPWERNEIKNYIIRISAADEEK